MNRKQKKTLARILVSALLLLAAEFLPAGEGPWGVVLYLLPYFLIGWDVLWSALLGIVHGQLLDENFLMALATVGGLATRNYDEAVFVMLFYQLGEWFQSVAVERSRRSIGELMDIRPDIAHIETGEGQLEDLDPEDVDVGAVLVVKPGERVALDGVVLSGRSTLDAAALTGESAPREVAEGDEVLSGCVNQSGVLRVRVTAPSEESTVSRILELVENASEKKAKSEQFITRFARWYTPSVVLAAAALWLLPSLGLWFLPAASLPGFLAGTAWTDWLHRALIFLVISCPCALVISVPLSFFGGLGGASKRGILVKGSNYLERLAQTDTVVFDKTGTLTEGRFSVTEVRPAEGFTQEELLKTAALAERWSDHPISQSLRRACPETAEGHEVTEAEELPGHGIHARVDGAEVLVGNPRLLADFGLSVPEETAENGTLLYVAVDGRYAGRITVSDRPKAGAREAIAALRSRGVKRIVMLSGDRQETAEAVGRELGVDEARGNLLPADKVAAVESLLQEGGSLAFVGDGVNDAPVLARADVGVAMGALGSDAAIEAADVVLMDDKPEKLAQAMGIARKTLRIVKQNIAFALGVKALVLVLAALGYAPMGLAVFSDVGVMILAILNAMRCLY